MACGVFRKWFGKGEKLDSEKGGRKIFVVVDINLSAQMQSYQISNDLRNFCRPFEEDLSKPQMNRLKELMHGIIRGQKGTLSEIARQNRRKQKKTIRKQVQQYSDMLPKFPLETMIVRKLMGMKSKIESDTALYFDLVDITKKYHKSLEKIGNTWDGSEGVPGRGYEMVDVSLGTSASAGMSLYRHLYSTENIDYSSQVKEIEQVLQLLIAAWGEIRGTAFVDSGGDNNHLIELFLKYEAGFAIRMNVNRGSKDRLVLNERGDSMKMMDLWGKVQGVTAWHDAKKRKRKLVQLQWRKVWWRHQNKLLPMSMVWSHREGDPDPCVFLTSRAVTNEFAAAKVYEQYFQRGGKEEAVFKCNKTKLGMEKVQLCSFEKVKQFMLIYVLVDQFLAKLQEQALAIGHLLHTFLTAFVQGAQRKITKWAIIDFYDETYAKLEQDSLLFRNRFWPSPPASQLSLFLNPSGKW